MARIASTSKAPPVASLNQCLDWTSKVSPQRQAGQRHPLKPTSGRMRVLPGSCDPVSRRKAAAERGHLH